MAESPRVSVIIIFLNGEQYLAEAIDSVIDQTYVDWELLLADDGSTDGSPRIAGEYAARYPGKIRYIEHPGHRNKGMSATRNLGIANARGEYVAFLDADDVWLPMKLTEQVDILDAHPEADMVYGPGLWWHSWSDREEDAARDTEQRFPAPVNTVIPPPELFLRFIRTPGATPCPSVLLVRRTALESIGGFVASFTGLMMSHEDQAFYSRFTLKHPVYVSDRIWFKYRQHPNSFVSMTTGGGKIEIACGRYLQFVKSHLAEQGLRGTAMWKAVNQRLFEHYHPNLVKGMNFGKRAMRKALRLLHLQPEVKSP